MDRRAELDQAILQIVYDLLRNWDSQHSLHSVAPFIPLFRMWMTEMELLFKEDGDHDDSVQQHVP